MSSQKAYGFYPEKNNDTKAFFGGTVPGEMINEATKDLPSSILTSRLIVQVNKSPFVASQAKIDEWETSEAVNKSIFNLKFAIFL